MACSINNVSSQSLYYNYSGYVGVWITDQKGSVVAE